MTDWQNQGFARSSAGWPECSFVVHGWNAWLSSSGQPAYSVPWTHACIYASWCASGQKRSFFCFSRPISEVLPMSTSCPTLEKMSLSHTNSITRRSSGHGAVFLGWEILTNPMLAGTSNSVISIYVCIHTFCSHKSYNLEAESVASQPVLPVPLHVQTDNMAASRPVASLLNGGGSCLSESGPFQTSWSKHRCTKGAQTPGGGGRVQGHIPLGEFCNCGPQEALFLQACILRKI